MDKTIAMRWADALDSGEFDQGRGALCHNGRYCCLGVLSELAVREGITTARDVRWSDQVSREYGTGKETCTLPGAVEDWAGMASTTGQIMDGAPGVPAEGIAPHKSLAGANDAAVPFTLIAAHIRAHYEHL